jgi:hypothetical protein
MGGDTERMSIAVAKARAHAVDAIRAAIVLVAHRGAGQIPAGWADAPVESALPFRSALDRRAEVRAATGEIPLLWRAWQHARQHHTAGRVHLYLDVSGSMNRVLPLLYAATVPLLDYIEPVVHLFSTTVADVNRSALRRGFALTAHGTEIKVVTEHMIKRRVRRAVIVTDGWVGDVPGEHARLLERRRVRVAAVVTHGGDPRFIIGLRGRAVRLPDLALLETK